MNDLFEKELAGKSSIEPLAEQMRPQFLEDILGQEHLLGTNKPLRNEILNDQLASYIFWGPPGCGKTTLARLIARHTKRHFVPLSAVLGGLKEIREIIAQAKSLWQRKNQQTLLFVDEVHRFNKAQQDAFLPHVEDGTILFIGATTQNPSFEIISALLSRCRVLILKPLEESDLKKLFQKTWGKILPSAAIPDDQVIQALVTHASGDARRLLNALEAISYEFQSQADPLVDLKRVAEILSAPNLTYDRNGEEHYNVISAFIKSMRGSDPDATLYYLARMLESGEDPRFVARRMIIFASEDVGNADSRALSLALDAAQAFERIGLPEGWIPLAHCATYLAAVPKSNAAYRGYLAAKRDVLNSKNETVPLHLRNAPTKLMKQLEYGKNYQYPHNDPGNWNDQTYLPEALKERIYYEPSQNGLEAKIKAYLDPIRKARRKTCQ